MGVIDSLIQKVEGKLEVEPVAAATPDVKKESDTMAKKNGSNGGNGKSEPVAEIVRETEQDKILGVLLEAAANRRYVYMRYQTDNGSRTTINNRTLIPFHLWESNEGLMTVMGFDGLRKEVRTFTVAKIHWAELHGKAPAPAPLDDGKVRWYPAKHKVRHCKPQVANAEGNGYANGGNWANEPAGCLLTPNA